MKKTQIEVQKYGGTSVGDLDKIAKVAQHIKECLAADLAVTKKIVVVVSAMDKTTDKLIAQARELAPDPDPRELDQLLQTGETKSAALLAIKLLNLGIKARSFTASQIGLETNNRYGNAAIFGLRDKDLIFRLLEQFDVLVITGFQGIAPGEITEITTVGRGGSDAIAITLAAELKAAYCNIYTDVDGIYTAKPDVVEGAKKFEIITFEQMIDMCEAGAEVMMVRSVMIAKEFNIPITVKLSPSFGKSAGGTVIKNPPTSGIESPRYTEFAGLGIKKLGSIKITGLPNIPGATYKLLKGLGINIFEIIKLPSEPSEPAALAIVLERQNIARAIKKLREASNENENPEAAIYHYEDLVSLTIVDPNMVDSLGYTERMLKILAERSINDESIFSAHKRLGVIVKENDYKKAAQALAEEFGLTDKS